MAHHDEPAVVTAFADWLRAAGWSVRTEINFADVVAERDGERLICEAKGRTSAPDTDCDTAYGQLLRRMPADDSQASRYGLVIRDEPRSVRAALRVPAGVRALLRITVYAVADDRRVRVLDTEP
jgi:hypothetical protein